MRRAASIPRRHTGPETDKERHGAPAELGLFFGMLGRGKVCALHKGDLELPSDFHGVLYTPLDPDGAWQLKLARELRASGLSIDLNRVLG
jgi:predicted nucleotide-binding protein